MSMIVRATHKETQQQVLLVHDTERDGKDCVLTVIKPTLGGGRFSGEQLATYVLAQAAARELKGHL